MAYKVSITNTGKFAVVDGAGITRHTCNSEFEATTWVENLNRANYEPNIDAYYPAGRWTNVKAKERAA